MSALGQKQTCAVQKVMSALPPKADMCSALGDVRFVPIADIASFVIDAGEQSRRDDVAERWRRRRLADGGKKNTTVIPAQHCTDGCNPD